MRINKFLAQATGLSRRAADTAIAAGRVRINGASATLGQDVSEGDTVQLDGKRIDAAQGPRLVVMLNKPPGYVVSRDGQGSRTIYELLPPECQSLQPIGRLDKNSSGLLLLTNDGQLAQELTHPSRQKSKVYEVALDKPLQPLHRQMISDHGIMLDDGLSRLQLDRLHEGDDRQWQVTMYEGRNRQIRRTFGALGYDVTRLHRIALGRFLLGGLPSGRALRLPG